MPRIIRVGRCDFTIQEATSNHANIDNVRTRLAKDVYGNDFFIITFDVFYVNGLPGDIGGGMGLGYDVYDAKGYKVDDGNVFMPRMKLGEKARAEIQIEYVRVAGIFSRFSVVV